MIFIGNTFIIPFNRLFLISLFNAGFTFRLIFNVNIMFLDNPEKLKVHIIIEVFLFTIVIPLSKTSKITPFISFSDSLLFVSKMKIKNLIPCI